MHSVYKYHKTKRLGDHSPPDENNIQKKKITLQLKEPFSGSNIQKHWFLTWLNPALLSNCLGLHKPVGEPQHHCGKPFFYQVVTQVLQHLNFASRLLLAQASICFCSCLTCTHETPDPLIYVNIYCLCPDLFSVTFGPIDFLLEHSWS